ncbi:GDSL-type esterase/lipase family protein [Streptomyces sp. NPDC056437]|uniref:GDSL-type esterase/lipase family protein n=1 Tax=Streptomyces sp. NPDC056437 TaxID=3345816 RepID=UPI0036C297E2
MNMRRGYATLAGVTAVIVLICSAIYLGVEAAQGRTAVRTAVGSPAVWVGTWAAAPVQADLQDTARGDRSVRNVVHTSIGGSAARLTLSNLAGREPLHIARVSLALRAGTTAAAVPGTLRRVTFRKAEAVTIAPGGQFVSDPVTLGIPYNGDLLVSIHTPADGPVTLHPRARQTSYLADGDRTDDVSGDSYTEQTFAWRHLTAVDVLTQDVRGAVVTIGDSITDGVTSTIDTNRRWPDRLFERLNAHGTEQFAVVNQGISGNRLLLEGRGPSALARFDRDVLARPGVRTVIVAIGINDLLRASYEPDAASVTAGLTQLARRAQARDLRVLGATLLPCAGHHRCTRAVQEARQDINAAVRSGRIFDAVVDFDRALRDPYAPGRLLPRYDSGDHLHPSDAGFARMARAVDPARL